MDVDQLFGQRPMLHRDHLGRPAYWAIGEDVARLLDREVAPGNRTLETGAGLSTIMFAIKGAQHTCVVPDAGLVDRIVAFCKEAEITTDNISFEIGLSQDVLPRLNPSNLDLVLIDGAHAFPIPFIDWFYTARTGLRDSGILVIDDTQLWTGRVLVDFLCSEPNWSLEQQLGKSSVLKRKGNPFLGDWTAQLFVIYGPDLNTANRMKRAVAVLREQIPDGASFVAIDESQLGLERLGMLEGRRPLPFPDTDGKYAGKPPDDATAVGELERARAAGATFLVIFWPAFWWLDHYAAFAHYIRSRFPRVLADDDVVIFDLKSSPPIPSETADGVHQHSILGNDSRSAES
jgi:hypothetical protein